MSEREQQSLLQIDFATVAELLDRPKDEFFSPQYLKENLRHMQEFQPGLADLIEEQQMQSFKELVHFRSGAFSTYDLVYSADPDYWSTHEINDQVFFVTKKNFTDSAIILPDNEVRSDRERVVVDLHWFYEKATEDSPVYKEWLDWMTDNMEKDELKDYVFGSLLTAMPFYLTRENEKFEKFIE